MSKRTRYQISVKTLGRPHQVSAQRFAQLLELGLITLMVQPNGALSRRYAKVSAGVYAWLSDEGVLEFFDYRRPLLALTVLRMKLNCTQLERCAPRRLDRTQFIVPVDPPGAERFFNQ